MGMPADKWQNINTMTTDSVVFFIYPVVAVTGEDDPQGLISNGGRL
jgi:hypothetical protein